MTKRRLFGREVTWLSATVIVVVLAVVAMGLISGLLRQKGFRRIVQGSVDLCSIPGAAVVIDGAVIMEDELTEAATARQEIGRAAGESLTAAEARDKMLDTFVARMVVADESRRRGSRAEPGAGAAQLGSIKEVVAQSPELRATVDHMLAAQGVPTEHADAWLLKQYQRTADDNSLFEQVRLEVPEPSESEIGEFLSQHVTGSSLLLITMTFTDTQDAEAMMTDLVTTKGNMSSNEFETEFWARTQEHEQKSSEDNLSTSFDFHSPEELPDFAQDAAQKSPGDIGLHHRNDGTTVIYYVSSHTSSTAVMSREQAIPVLKEKAYESRRAALTEELISKADVKICQR